MRPSSGWKRASVLKRHQRVAIAEVEVGGLSARVWWGGVSAVRVEWSGVSGGRIVVVGLHVTNLWRLAICPRVKMKP